MSYDDLVAAGSMNAAKAAGKMRIEGKDFVMAYGDVVEFRFNVWIGAFVQLRGGVGPLSPHRVRKKFSPMCSMGLFLGARMEPSSCRRTCLQLGLWRR